MIGETRNTHIIYKTFAFYFNNAVYLTLFAIQVFKLWALL